MKKIKEKSNRGGKREGAGRKPGKTKEFVGATVDAEALKAALKKSGVGRSALFNKLVCDYVAAANPIPAKAPSKPLFRSSAIKHDAEPHKPHFVESDQEAVERAKQETLAAKRVVKPMPKKKV